MCHDRCMSSLFTGESMCWLGSNLAGASDARKVEYRRHLDRDELAASDGSVLAHRLEKLPQIPRRWFGPDYLSVFEYADADAAKRALESHLKRDDGSATWSGAREPMWRIAWRKVSDSGVTTTQTERVRFIAMSPPDDATDQEVDEWNSFYTEVHVREAMQRRHWTRATRWECQAAPLHPHPGSPRFVVLYEATGFTDVPESDVAALGPWTEGPTIWKRNVTSWVLDYRTIKGST